MIIGTIDRNLDDEHEGEDDSPECPTGNITLENGIVTILNDDGGIYDKIDISPDAGDRFEVTMETYSASDALAAIEFKVTDFDSYYDRYSMDRNYRGGLVENLEEYDDIIFAWADDQADFAKYLAAKTLDLPDKDKYLDPLRARPTQLAKYAALEAESAAREAESAARSAAREAESAKPKQLVLLDEIKECFQKYYSTASSETEKETKKIERDCTKRIKLLHPNLDP